MDSFLSTHLSNVVEANRKSADTGKKQKAKHSSDSKSSLREEKSSYARRARKDNAEQESRVQQITSLLALTQPQKKSRKKLRQLVKIQTGAKDKAKKSTGAKDQAKKSKK